ncbi:thiamine pyrophosphate-binding protein [Chloroflexota bacterium]
MITQHQQLTEAKIIDEINKCGFTHVIWLPDSGNQALYEGLVKQLDVTVIPVCREGEAIAIAAGLTWVGKNPLLLHQNSGFLESGDSLRGIAFGTRLPLLIILSYFGWKREGPIVHTAAIYTEPVLKGWGIKYYLITSDEDVAKISLAYKEAHDMKQPIVILIGREL